MADSRKIVNFRVTPEQERMLDELTMTMGQSRNEYLVSLITEEYDRIKGNPELMHMIEQMNDLKKQFEKFNGSSGT